MQLQVGQGSQHKARYIESDRGEMENSLDFIVTGRLSEQNTDTTGTKTNNTRELTKLKILFMIKDIITQTNLQTTEQKRYLPTTHPIDGYYVKHKKAKIICYDENK